MESHEQVGQLVCPKYKNLGIPALYVHDLTGTKNADRLLSQSCFVHSATVYMLLKLR
jgi:hypothetical protein